MKKTLDLSDLHFLSSMAMLAADHYRQNAATFLKLAGRTPEPHDLMQISGDAALNMSRQFVAQAEQASYYCQLFQAVTEDIEVEFDPELVEEDENPFHSESPEGRAWQAEHAA